MRDDTNNLQQKIILKEQTPKYYINAIGCTTNMEISEKEFYKIKNAKDFLHFLYQIETKYDFITGNYFDLQKTLLQSQLDTTLFSKQFNILHISQQNRLLNRILFNYLSTTKLYFDQIHLPEIFADNPIKEEINRYLLDFRNDEINNFMIELRNHMQHSSISSHLSIQSTKKVNPMTNNNLVFNYTTLFLDIDNFLQDKELSKQTRKQYKENAKNYVKKFKKNKCELELIEHIFKFYANIVKFHYRIRELLNDNKEKSMTILDEMYQNYKAIVEQETAEPFEYIPPQNLMKIHTSQETIIITTNIMNYIKELEQQNKMAGGAIICNASKKQMQDWDNFY